MVRCGTAIALLLLCSFTPPCVAAPDYVSRPGTVPYTLALPDAVEVTLDNVVVELVLGSYVFVRDPWTPTLLPVHAVTYLDRGTSIEVTGTTATVSGKRILEATSIR